MPHGPAEEPRRVDEIVGGVDGQQRRRDALELRRGIGAAANLPAGLRRGVACIRDEGVALSVSEGTASVRLAKFDRDHEYFEIDAPKTTLAAEKKGLYRVDVSRDGHVRLGARDGGLRQGELAQVLSLNHHTISRAERAKEARLKREVFVAVQLPLSRAWLRRC